MKPAFEEHRVDQALEKIAEVIHQQSGGYGAPSWAEAHGKDVVEALEQLEERMRARNLSLQQGGFPTAIYASRELRKYLAGGKSDIANKDAAEVFYRVLVNLIEELRSLDQKLAREEAA
jgi:hypothetical protein